MAFSKTPVQDTHTTFRVPSLGSAFNTTSDDRQPQSLNYFNCFPEMYRQYQKDPMYRVVKREAIKTDVYSIAFPSSTISIGIASLLAPDNSENVYFEHGTDYVLVDWNSGAPTASRITAFNGQANGNSIGTIAVDNSNVVKIVWLNQNADILVANASDGTGGVINTPAINLDPLAGLEFLNGYLFAVDTDGKIYNSTAGGVLGTWATTDFIVPEIYPDRCLYLSKHKNHLVAFGQNSIEFFYDGAVEVGSPLVRQESYTSRVGFYSNPNIHRPLKIDDDIYFIGKNENRDLGVYRIRNFEVQEISTPAISKFLNWSDGTYPATSQNSNMNNFNYLRFIHLNGEPMIFLDFDIEGTDSIGPVYNIKQNLWWTGDFSGEVAAFKTNMFFSDNWVLDGGVKQARRPWMITESDTHFLLHTVDREHSVSVNSHYTSEILDNGVNNQRHIKYVDLIGDYGNNSVSLAMYTDSTYTNQVTFVGGTQVDDNPIRIHNLGRQRRYALVVSMFGSDIAHHEAFEVTINRGTN